MIRTLGPDQTFSNLSAHSVAQRVRALHGGEVLNILAMSAGGADGAFGAGALVGLTRSGSRPQFAIVTGVGPGALIAPYAFLGPAWDSQLVEIYTTGRAEHLQPRGLGAMFGSSANRGRPLKQLVDRHTTDALIQAVAHEAAAGRLLLIVTTDVETGEPVAWDLGSIAMNGGPNARTLFRDVLLASASEPGMLPPVIIRVHEQNTMTEEAHVGGMVSVPLFVPSVLTEMPEGRLWISSPRRGGHANGDSVADSQHIPCPVDDESEFAGCEHWCNRSMICRSMMY
jgi:predicted acylesterase/phospholipase RssA